MFKELARFVKFLVIFPSDSNYSENYDSFIRQVLTNRDKYTFKHSPKRDYLYIVEKGCKDTTTFFTINLEADGLYGFMGELERYEGGLPQFSSWWQRPSFKTMYKFYCEFCVALKPENQKEGCLWLKEYLR